MRNFKSKYFSINVAPLCNNYITDFGHSRCIVIIHKKKNKTKDELLRCIFHKIMRLDSLPGKILDSDNHN